MKLTNLILAAAALAVASPAVAEGYTRTASNGVVVDVNADEFAGRYEYSAPTIKLEGGVTGIALVARVNKAGATGDVHVQGFAMYSGDWRYYENAVFRGGEAVDFTRTRSDVGSCRYGCTLTEGFSFNITPDQMTKYAEDGIVTVQVRAGRSSDHYLIKVPVSYFEAVKEVSQG